MSESRWVSVALRDLAAEITSGATPQSGSTRYYVETGGIPFVKIDDLTAASNAYISDTFLQVNESALRETALKRYPAGTLLLSMYGTVGLVKIASREVAANQALAAILPPFNCNSKFLYHLLDWLRPRWERFKAQTTQANISGAIVKDFDVELPPQCEQRRIAEIIDALDDQIRFTEQIISKLETMRIGLTHDLLRVGSDGDWKPDCWNVQPLGEIIAGIDAGKSPDCPNRPAGAGRWGVLKVSAVGAHGFLEEENKEIPVSVPVDRQNEIHSGDVLMTRANTPDLVGMVCVVRKQPSARLVLSDKTWRIKPGPMIGAGFLVEALRSPPARRFIQSQATGTSGSMKNIPKTAACKIRLPVPSLSEQRKIATILAAEREREDSERAKAAGLRALKKGLMADLLTGRVRVPVEALS